MDIAIIGGGAGGVLLALHLLRHARTHSALGLHLVEARPQLAQGIAYGTASLRHFLNVPAGNMSAFPDLPMHFVQWLDACHAETRFSAESFVPRPLYARYLRDSLAQAQTQAPQHIVQHHLSQALRLQVSATGYQIDLANGKRLSASAVVLALGNFPAPAPAGLSAAVQASEFFIGQAWHDEALRRIPPHAQVICMGTGLSMADILASLDEQGFAGQVFAFSRRGMLPQAHLPEPLTPVLRFDFQALPTRLIDLFRWVRQLAQHEDGRHIIDALRPHTARLWARLSVTEQRRFIRHLAPYWNVLRHRLPTPSAELLRAWHSQGRFTAQAARLLGAELTPTGIRLRLQSAASAQPYWTPPAYVVNCTGAELQYHQVPSALLQDLFAQGIVHSDTLGLGLATQAEGQIINAQGTLQRGLWTLGTARRGTLWETGAIPELRWQAQQIAQHILQDADMRKHLP